MATTMDTYFDKKTGQYKVGDASVSQRLTGIMSQNNPLIRQARAQGTQVSNRRGLLNSSMGAQAGETAAYSVALPIASQEAGQSHQSGLQKRDIHAAGERQRDQLAHEITIQQGSQAHQSELQQRDIEAAKDRLRDELGSREAIASIDAGSRIQVAQAGISADLERMKMEIASRENMLAFESEARERLSAMDLLAREKQNASALLAEFERSYSSNLNTIMNNANIPAEVRQQYMDHTAKMRESNYNLVEQLYGIDLDWS